MEDNPEGGISTLLLPAEGKRKYEKAIRLTPKGKQHGKKDAILLVTS